MPTVFQTGDLMTSFNKAWLFLKSVLRNKHTGEQFQLVGYDMVPDGATTHQVAILQNANGQTSRWEQRYLDAHFDYVGEV